MSITYYFAYGSNLLLSQMLARTDSTELAKHSPRIARLANHRLVFQHLTGEELPYANIISPGDGVLGVVYGCSPADLNILDQYEPGYDRQPVRVNLENGEAIAAMAYIMIPAQTGGTGSPSPEYLARIVTGAREQGLPEQYIDAVVGLANMPALK
jgi:gamma-glutamylcyclotransferase (GGCT)/AIG2-like uncharacterized protein YtfP